MVAFVFVFRTALLFPLLCHYTVPTAAQDDGDYDTSDPATTVLFPWVVQCLGVCIFFLLTRTEVPLPYAAVMFGVGTVMGAVASVRARSYDGDGDRELDQLSASILQWSSINSAVLLLVFLPGLIFRDAIEVNFGLFMKSLSQLVLLAFPMVLVGTFLTAVVSYYAFTDYGFPFSLAATLGAILSSTDPIAVGSVLKKAGAPPRLQMHISGESLLNDGAAVVFYTIFSQQYLAQLGIVDSDITVGQGFGTFFRMAGGGIAVGLAFAAGLLLMLYELDRRLEPEYNVLQVVAALTFAYLSYYVSEQVCQMSGVVACVVCGIGARALGRGMITDNQMMDSYLALMEHLLNTLLFTLGGVVWGQTIAESKAINFIDGYDWLYLILLYVLVVAIRFLQVGMFYPIFSRIGLRSNWREAAFLSFAGMRGAVSVALALSLSRSVREATEDQEKLEDTEVVEFLAGGVALLSLLINGSTAGPVLRWLGLVKPVLSRKQALRLFRASAEAFVNKEYQKILLEERFVGTNFKVVKRHVPFVTTPPVVTVAPSELSERIATAGDVIDELDPECSIRMLDAAERACPEETLVEMRHIFLELLNEAYSTELANGELDEREDNGSTIDVLRQSIEFALTDVEHRDSIQDFKYTQNFSQWGDYIIHSKSLALRKYRSWKRGQNDGKFCTYQFQQQRVAVLRAVAFIEAHHLAKKKLIAYIDSFATTSLEDNATSVDFSNAVDTVLNENALQVMEAQKVLDQVPCQKIETIMSNYVCTILLHRLANFVEQSAADGILTKKEARVHLDRIDRSLQSARTYDSSQDSILSSAKAAPRTRTLSSVDEGSRSVESFGDQAD